MIKIFVDTAGWACFIDKSQTQHKETAKIFEEIKKENGKFITTSYILAELVALLGSHFHISRSIIINFIENIKKSFYVEIIYIDKNIDDDAWKLLKKYQDKNWSLTDCTSFIVMQQQNITDSLTTDHHFKQAGFITLLEN